ncbi:unnamed protein product [Urochloa humidicola]
MPALPLLRLALSIAVLVQRARFLAAVARTNLTAGDTLTPPDYITSPSGGFGFGFRPCVTLGKPFQYSLANHTTDTGGGGWGLLSPRRNHVARRNLLEEP